MKPKQRTALLGIAELIAPEATPHVALACDDPAAYAKLRKKQLAERRLTEVIPWLALVDELERVKYLATIDWKTDTEDLVSALDRLASLPRRRGRWAWTKKREDLEDRDITEVLEIIGERLAREDALQLAQLDSDGDEYNLFLIPKQDVARVVALGKMAKLGDIDLFTGSDLEAFERERAQLEAAERAKRDTNVGRQRNFVHPDGRVWITEGNAWWPTDHPKQHFVMRIYQGKLGSQTLWRGGKEERITHDAKEIARWRAKEFADRLAEGYVELAQEAYGAAEQAATRAKKRKKRKITKRRAR